MFRTSDFMLTRSLRGLSPILTITALTTVAHAMSCTTPQTTLVSLSSGKGTVISRKILGDQTWTYFGRFEDPMVSRTTSVVLKRNCSRQTRYSDYRYRKSVCRRLLKRATYRWYFYFPGKRKHSRRIKFQRRCLARTTFYG